jgi:hypothetical protein
VHAESGWEALMVVSKAGGGAVVCDGGAALEWLEGEREQGRARP